MFRKWLNLYSERLLVLVLVLAVLVAGSREVYIINQFENRNENFRTYQVLNQNYTTLYKNFYALQSTIMYLESDLNLNDINSAVFYVVESLEGIAQMEKSLIPLRKEYSKANSIELNKLRGNYRKIKISLENSELSITEVQLLVLNILSALQEIEDDELVLAEEIKNKQLANYRYSIAFTLLFMLLSIIVLVFFAWYRELSFYNLRKLVKQNLKTLELGNLIEIEEEAEADSKSQSQTIEITLSMSNKLKALKKSLDSLVSENFEKSGEEFPYSKNSFIGNSFFKLIGKFKIKNSKLVEERAKFNLQMEVNDALSELEKEMRLNASSDGLFSLILQKIIKFLGVNQGGFFLVKNDDSLSLEAAYAYNYERIINKTIDIREGLVGTCAMEQNLLVLNEIPDNYIEIGSGLGEKKPKNLVLLPIVYQKRTIAVLELASFKTIENYQIDYLKEAASIVGLFLINRFREEQSMNDYFISNKSNMIKEISIEHLKDLNKEMVKHFSQIVGVLIFDKFGALFNFSKHINELLPFNLTIGSTVIVDILEEKYLSNQYLLDDNKYHKVNLKGITETQLLFYLQKNEQSDDMNDILFVYQT